MQRIAYARARLRAREHCILRKLASAPSRGAFAFNECKSASQCESASPHPRVSSYVNACVYGCGPSVAHVCECEITPLFQIYRSISISTGESSTAAGPTSPSAGSTS
eukprot:5251850-Pleurochrysis_carterae.AAC.1